VIVGNIVGVVTGSALPGAEVKIRPEGVYDLAKVPADALATGAIATVDPATGIVGAAGTKNIGWVVAAAPRPEATRCGCDCVRGSRDNQLNEKTVPKDRVQVTRNSARFRIKATIDRNALVRASVPLRPAQLDTAHSSPAP
jgi:predicted RecA/RadA family phage recombinase